MKLSKLPRVIIILIPFIFGIGCSDKSSNSNDNIPAELVGTWMFSSGTIDGEPMTPENTNYICESAVTHSMIFNSNGTWRENLYDEGMSQVCWGSGTFTVNADTLYLTETEFNGIPTSTPEESEQMTFLVSGNQLFITSFDFSITVVLIYNRI